MSSVSSEYELYLSSLYNTNSIVSPASNSSASLSSSSLFDSFLSTAMETLEKSEEESEQESNQNKQIVYNENNLAYMMGIPTLDKPYTEAELALLEQDLQNRLSHFGNKSTSSLTSEAERDLAVNYSIRSFDAQASLYPRYNEEGSELNGQYPEKAQRMNEIAGERTKEIYEKYGLDEMTKEELYLLDQSAEGKAIAQELFGGFKENEEMMALMEFFKSPALEKYGLRG